ncbi:hypothetical protein EDD86DRAFT_246554 [Gorgonomyces haynaldii]|nr:hypothetical protein EDD86DRAFT_246554 [Gorgonomyces haynaldii]
MQIRIRYQFLFTAFALLMFEQSLFVYWSIIGGIVTAILCKIIKKIIRQPRPSQPDSLDGMPSSHSMVSGYFFTILSLRFHKLLGFVGLAVPVSRVLTGHHTVQQTMVGYLLVDAVDRAESVSSVLPVRLIHSNYRDKERVKALGAKWIASERKWAIPLDADDSLFAKWLPQYRMYLKAQDRLKTRALEREAFAKKGALFCQDCKRWFIYTWMDTEPFQEWIENERQRIYLFVAFKDKDIVKDLGARWDPIIRRWYVLNGNQSDFYSWTLPLNQNRGTQT